MAALKLNIDLLKFPDSSYREKSKFGMSISGVLSSIKPRSEPFQSHLNIPKEYDPYDYKVFIVLKEFLQPNSEILLQEAAGRIIGIFPVGHLGMTALNTVCLECAEQIPYAHPSQLKLVRLLWIIGRKGKRVVNNGRNESIPSLWQIHALTKPQKIPEALHSFYQQLGEDIKDARMDPGDDDTTPERFVNFNSFSARLLNSGMWVATAEDAFRTMRRALEEGHKNESIEIQDAWIMGAAQWILWSGQIFLESLLWPYDDYNIISVQKDAMEKWHTWRDSFRRVSEGGGHGEECKGVAKRAVGIMEALETGMVFQG
ncbi:hypothetical protein V492_03150 [Pseudogymnoascus sp. VKM F-4246]|nr:hypothetical protein V492_03150 [Pseudogymnoascus sp. VKM F-4246]